jgi:hypothetical protein
MFLDALDYLPQTFCHRDANWRNLFCGCRPGGADQTVAVDWEQTGTGAIGEEIVGLVCSSLAFRQVDVTRAPELDRNVFKNYLLRLRDSGWRGDAQLVRFGFAASSALHYCFKNLELLLSSVLDESKHPWLENIYSQFSEKRCSMGEVVDRGAMIRRFLLDLAEEARALRSFVLKA